MAPPSFSTVVDPTTTAAATATAANGGSRGDGSSDWTPDSWRTRPIQQCPSYPEGPKGGEAGLRRATAELAQLPPLVHAREVEGLKRSLRDVARGEAFLLQGGDCAELFDYCRAGAIESKIKLLLQMSLALVWGADRRVVRVARMAGQYAKPRSSPTEVVRLPDGTAREVPSFRGDILNGHRLEDRELDPQRLVMYVRLISPLFPLPFLPPLPPFFRKEKIPLPTRPPTYLLFPSPLSFFFTGPTTTQPRRSTTCGLPSRPASRTCTGRWTGV